MEITLKEKIRSVVFVVDEARTVQKTNPVYVAVDYFSQSNLGFPNARDIFRVLRENKAIKSIKKSWVCEEVSSDGTRKIVKTGEEQANDDDYEAFEIEIDKEKWVSAKKLTAGAIKTAAILDDLIFNKDGLLYSKSNPEIKIGFGKDTARYKILDALIDAGGAYVLTKNLRDLSGKGSNRLVQKEIGAIKTRLARMLGIKKPAEDTIIQGEEYSGYRLLIKIKKSK